MAVATDKAHMPLTPKFRTSWEWHSLTQAVWYDQYQLQWSIWELIQGYCLQPKSGLFTGCLLNGTREAALPSILLLRLRWTVPKTTLDALVWTPLFNLAWRSCQIAFFFFSVLISHNNRRNSGGLSSLKSDPKLLSHSLPKVADLFPTRIDPSASHYPS